MRGRIVSSWLFNPRSKLKFKNNYKNKGLPNFVSRMFIKEPPPSSITMFLDKEDEVREPETWVRREN